MSHKRKVPRSIAVLGNPKVLCLAALFAAMSVVIAYLAKMIFGTSPLRLTLENLPIIFGSVSFGPLVGMMIAAVADLCSCLLSGQAPNPLILVGSLSIGLVSGVLGRYVFRKRRLIDLLAIECFAHVIGSMLLKTLALRLYFSFAWSLLLLRIPVYLLVLVVEAYLAWVLFRNGQVRKQLERMCGT